MIHFDLIQRTRPPVQPRGHAAPLTPAAYLRLRRKAAAVTEQEAARPLAPSSASLAVALDLVRRLETPGVVARQPETLDRLRSAFAFDPDVYRQLASEPADQHPRVCRGCGCSHWDPCVGGEGGGACAWETETTCTHCAALAGARS